GDGGRVLLGEGEGLVLEPLHQHLDVAHLAQQPGEPAGLLAQAGHPFGVEQGAERAQVGAQPAGADPGLVDVLGVVAQADAGVVPAGPAKVISRRLITGPVSPSGSFTVHGGSSPTRWRRLTPARARRRSRVS